MAHILFFSALPLHNNIFKLGILSWALCGFSLEPWTLFCQVLQWFRISTTVKSLSVAVSHLWSEDAVMGNFRTVSCYSSLPCKAHQNASKWDRHYHKTELESVLIHIIKINSFTDSLLWDLFKLNYFMAIHPFNLEPEQEVGKCHSQRVHQPVLGQHVDTSVGLAGQFQLLKCSGTVVNIMVSLPPPLRL